MLHAANAWIDETALYFDVILIQIPGCFQFLLKFQNTLEQIGMWQRHTETNLAELFIVKTSKFPHSDLKVPYSSYIQWNSVITNSVVDEHSVITNSLWSQISHFCTKINPVITNKNARSQAVRYNQVWLYFFISFTLLSLE